MTRVYVEFLLFEVGSGGRYLLPSFRWCLPPPAAAGVGNDYGFVFKLKGAATNENTTTSNGKRPRRKKTFKELKEQETSLIKERTHLNKQLVSLRSTLEEQRTLNENLKRIKLDLPVEFGLKSEPLGKVSINFSPTGTGEDCCTTILEDDPSSMQHARSEAVFVTESSSSSVLHKDPVPQEDGPAGFVLPDLNGMPDLNTMPMEEDVVVGVRAC